MSPAISFSSVEFVRAILEGRKTQTIRPLWKFVTGKTIQEMFNKLKRHQNYGDIVENIHNYHGYSEDGLFKKDRQWSNRYGFIPKMPTAYVIKKPRLKIGDETISYFKQRSTPKDSLFCWYCGMQVWEIEGNKWSHACIHKEYSDQRKFPKHFTTVKITEVFEIEMGKNTIGFFRRNNEIMDLCFIDGFGKNRIEELAKRDGFTSAKEMFNWFNKNYDLSTPKRFMVARWGK